MKNIEKIINRKTDYTCSIFKVESLDVELVNGKIALRNVVRHNGAICVIPFKDENTVLMVEQYRTALDDFVLEFPAGKLEIGEDPKECCMRELEEETSYTSASITNLGKIVTTPGFCDEMIHIFRADELQIGRSGLQDEDEFLTIHEVTLDEFKRLVKTGKIIDGKTLAAFCMLLQ